MKTARRAGLLAVAALAAFALCGCSDNERVLAPEEEEWLVIFQSLEGNSDDPTALRIGILVRTSRSQTPAPDGTRITVDTSNWLFENDDTVTVTETTDGVGYVVLLLGEPGTATLVARALGAEASALVLFESDGSVSMDG